MYGCIDYKYFYVWVIDYGCLNVWVCKLWMFECMDEKMERLEGS